MNSCCQYQQTNLTQTEHSYKKNVLGSAEAPQNKHHSGMKLDHLGSAKRWHLTRRPIHHAAGMESSERTGNVSSPCVYKTA